MKQLIDAALAEVKWEACAPPEDVSDGMLYMTQTGVLRLGGLELQCAVLSDGQRIFYGQMVDELIAGLQATRKGGGK